MYARFEAEIEQLNQQVLEQAGQRPTAGLLMTHPGVGPITALATDVFLGDPKRFRDGKALASYIGIIPRDAPAAGDSGREVRASKAIRFCAFSGVRPRHTRCAGIQNCGGLIGAS